MKKIVLFCSSGMSSSLMPQKIVDAGKAQGFPCEVKAYDIAKINDCGKDADMILLAPQVRFMAEEVREKLPGIPCLVIDMMDYGTMNGQRVLKKIADELNKKN